MHSPSRSRSSLVLFAWLAGLVPLESGCDEMAARPIRPGLDAHAIDDAALPPGVDAGPVDAARATEGLDAATSESMADAVVVGSDTALSDAAATAPTDCSGFVARGELCEATPSSCTIVFTDRVGCAAACRRGGMTCGASFRDHDDVTPALCEAHPSREPYACAETGHASDYCVCVGGGSPPDPVDPDPMGADPTDPDPADPTLAFAGAEGFGARSEGGRGGTVYRVTNLDDSGAGSLRWAVERSGRRIVLFDVAGVIRLRSALDIDDPFLTIDGRGALDPGEAGITIRDYPIDVRTHDVVIRYLRVRLGDSAVLRRVRDSGRSRPSTSIDLDCINIDRARDVILDHISASWSTDEIVSVTNSREVTIQWSILSEPISNPMAHPYGDDHAYAANNSAATLTYHHNLFAHFVMRAPQFEANDMPRSSPAFDAMFESVNNVVYAYQSTGSRFRTGFELASDRITSVDFMYQFVGNRYLNADRARSEIQADDRYGVERNIFYYFAGNIGPHRSAGDPETDLVFTDSGGRDALTSAERRQVSATPLFTSTVPVTTTSADIARDAVFADAGCSIERDAIDRRIVDDARAVRPIRVIHSQSEVPGGWPTF